MKCSIFKSPRKQFTYIYLLDGHEYEDLPAPLRNVFGQPELVMELELDGERKLAYEDVNEVMKNLELNGFHLQMPPREDATGLLQLPNEEEKLL